MAGTGTGASSSVAVTAGALKEVSKLMHGFGDGSDPDPASVFLVNDALMQFVEGVLMEGSQVCRDGGTLRESDILFALRKNPRLLHRALEMQDKKRVMDQAKAMHRATESGSERGASSAAAASASGAAGSNVAALQDLFFGMDADSLARLGMNR